MARILIVDDEPLYIKMVAHAILALGCTIDTAENGEQALDTAHIYPPDLIICDVLMPGLSGYEVIRRLRREPQFANTPIIVLTAQSELEEKLEAFEAGADDHMTKPFAPAELSARVVTLLRRGETSRKMLPPARPIKSKILAVQSLRGGLGCSSLAVNLAIALNGLWDKPTLLMDLVLTAGQVTLMLNGSLKRTWADIARFKPNELDQDALQSIMGKHESGLHYIAAPTFPIEAELLTVELFNTAFKPIRTQFDYIVADLPHDFTEIPVQLLDSSDVILLVLAPEMASLRAAAAAIDTYKKLGYSQDKIKLVLNWIFERKGLARNNIEAALHHPLDLVIPYTPDFFIDSINLGKPFMHKNPDEKISALIEDFAFQLSKPDHRETEPEKPTAGWQRVQSRLGKKPGSGGLFSGMFGKK